MIPTITTATLRPTVTTTITDTSLSSSSSSAKDRSVLIPEELPDGLFHKIEANNLWRSILAFLFVFCNMNLNLTALAIIHERVPSCEPPLPDLAFDILPYADRALYVAEYIIVFQVLGVFVLIFLHNYRFVFRNFILFSIQNLVPNKKLVQCLSDKNTKY
jgi:hypothetical protein